MSKKKEWLIKITREAYDLADENGRVDNSTGCLYVRQINISAPELRRVDVSTTVIGFTEPDGTRVNIPAPERVAQLLWDFKDGILWGGIISEYADLVEDGIILKRKNGHIRAPKLPPSAAHREEKSRKNALRKAKYAKETPAQRQAREKRNAELRGKHRGTVSA